MITRIIKSVSVLALIAILVAVSVRWLVSKHQTGAPCLLPSGSSLPATLSPMPTGVPPPPSSTRPTAPSQLPIGIKTLLGLPGVPADYRSRSAALRTLTCCLPADEIALLLTFLETPFSASQGLRPVELNSLKSDVLGVLLSQDQPVTNLGVRVVATYLNLAHDDIWRDYCLQYLADCYEAVPSETAPDTPRDKITTAYWDAAAQSGKTFAGTALIGLETLSKKYPEIDREKVGLVAVALADDESTCEATRITALRLCGKMKRAEALESARIVAQTGKTIPLRMAAIATLGDLGELQDLEYLQGTAAHEAPRLKPVLEAAVKAIRTRLGATKG